MRINLARVRAIVIRHLFTWPREWERLAEAFWWPSFDLFIWGLTTMYLQKQQGVPAAFVSIFLGAIILWMIVYRSQQEMGITLLIEVWNHNLLSLFTTPLTIWEFSIATLILGIVKLVISAGWMIFLAWILFTYNIFSVGWYIVPFALNLFLVGWSAGFAINGLIVRYGNRVQAFAWTLILLIQPFSAVFYSVSSLPMWMQVIAKILPTSYIFEGMRAAVTHGSMNLTDLAIATGLNVVYLVGSIVYFSWSFRAAQEKGMLLKFS